MPYQDPPEDMQNARRWLVWKPVSDGKKLRKKPFYVNGTPRRKPLDGPDDVAQLVTYSEAVAALQAWLAGQGYGLGFALGPDGRGGYWQGVDFDDVDANGLADLVNAAPGYVEYSPSGNGAHAIGYGPKFQNMASDESGIEAYCEARFFTFTGKRIK